MSQGQQYEMPRVQTYAHYAGGGSFYGSGSQEYQMNSFGSTYSEFLKMDADLVGRYIDYEDMDDSPLISTCLDIYADDATQPDHMTKKSIWIECDDEVIREDLDDNLLHRVLNVEDRIWGEVRALCKYGNMYGELVVKDKMGVLAKNNMPQPLVRKVELPLDDYGHQKLGGFMYDQTGSFKLSTNEFIQEMENRMNGIMPDFTKTDPNKTTRVLEDWEVVHMKLMSKKLESFYGWGIAESARWVFKRLVLLEDSILLHRLTRAPARFAFYIDVSQVPPNEVKGYLNQVKQAIKKRKYLNPETNKMDQRFDVLSANDDFFLPVRNGQESTRVESLAGAVYDHIEDVKFFENKLFAALKVPKPFLTYEESTAKTNLSAEDARFARTIMRIQREYRNGYKKVCNVHLAAKGINPSNVDFTVRMTIPSAIFELAQLEIKQAQLELANNFQSWAPKYWIMTEILGFSDEQIQKMEEMRLREMEPPDVGGDSGGASGAIDKMTSKRGKQETPARSDIKPATPPEPSETPAGPVSAPEHRTQRNTEKYLFDGKSKNMSELKTRIEELKHSDKNFSRKLDRIESYMKDLQSSLRK